MPLRGPGKELWNAHGFPANLMKTGPWLDFSPLLLGPSLFIPGLHILCNLVYQFTESCDLKSPDLNQNLRKPFKMYSLQINIIWKSGVLDKVVFCMTRNLQHGFLNVFWIRFPGALRNQFVSFIATFHWTVSSLRVLKVSVVFNSVCQAYGAYQVIKR